MKKNIMLLAVNFPPYDGGRIGASIRAYTMAEFLAKNGYSVHVVIPKRFAKNREEPDFHKNITIHRYFSPFQYYDHVKKLPLMHWLLKGFFAVNRRILQKIFINPVDIYLPFTFCFCKKIVVKRLITTVISTAPPLSVLTIAEMLKKKYRDQLFWISDMRDISFIHPTGKKKTLIMHKSQKNLELKLLNLSDRILVVSKGMKKVLITSAEKNNHININENKYLIVENGYSAVGLKEPQIEFKKFVEKAHQANKIVILYAGIGILETFENGFGKNKTLNCFIDILANDPYLSEKYALILQGVIKNTNDYFRNLKTKLCYLILKPVKNEVMRANMPLSDIGINLNVDKEYAPLIMGGKVYDYCVSELALFLIFPDNADSLKDFAKKHNDKPFFANVDDSESIKKVLYDLAENPEELKKRKFTKIEMESHSRENQYKKILKILE